MSYQLAGILDTRPDGRRGGIRHKCGADGCHKSSYIWVCLEEIKFQPKGETSGHYATTGKKLVVGTECVKKLINARKFPLCAEYTMLEALECPPVSINSREGKHLFDEFRHA